MSEIKLHLVCAVCRLLQRRERLTSNSFWGCANCRMYNKLRSCWRCK